jgi:hypothetical protein
VVALAADIRSLVVLEWACLVVLAWECLVPREWECLVVLEWGCLVALEWACLVALEWGCLVAREWGWLVALERESLAAPEWERGAVLTGMASIFTMIISIAMIILITMRRRRRITSTKSSLSETSAFHGGGVGAGVLGGVGVGIRGGAVAGATHTDTTAATVPVMDMAIAVGLEWPSYRADLLVLAITMGPSTESWGVRLEGQFGRMSAIMDT